MAEMLSPCCGTEYSDFITEESTTMYICDQCKDQFEEPIEDYEYSEQMKEAKDEDRADEERDMGHYQPLEW